jgi:DNA-binding PadR family transcriptional regulator
METTPAFGTQTSPNREVKCLNHTFHLYTPKVDKYTIQRAFLIPAQNEKQIVYVTTSDQAALMREFNPANVKLRIIPPEGLKELQKEENREMQLIVDAGSMVDQKSAEIEERENFLNAFCKARNIDCLCTYDVAKLSFEKIKQLAGYHNQLRLTTSDLTILSGDLFDESKVSGDSIEKMVKDNLESIILAILQKETMCGTDIIGTIHLKFNVLLSPGTIYPLLHSLKQKGLLSVKKSGKEIVYAPVEDAKPKIRRIVNEHIQARRFLNQYLQEEIKFRGAE